MARDPNPIKKIVTEEFRNYRELLITLNIRPNNEHMKNENSSESNGKDFTGTSSYKEAEELLAKGYTQVVGQLKKSIEAQRKLDAKFMAAIERPMPHNSIVGYIPNVPNAIQGIPQSMIGIDRKPMKRKTLSIIYCIGANCGTDEKEFTKAGAALLSAIDIIEKRGIQTKISVCFFPAMSEHNDTFTFPTVKIKNYGERYSIQKISFPIAHPSMFRRIGFKWIETSPEIKSGYSFGYGHSPSQNKYEEIEKIIRKNKEDYLINMNWILAKDCSVEEILKKLEVI